LSGKKGAKKGGMSELEIQRSKESLKQQNQNFKNIISSKNDLENNEKKFIKEFIDLIISQGNSSNYQELNTKYLATNTEERLNQLKGIAKKIFAEMGQINAKRQRQKLGSE